MRSFDSFLICSSALATFCSMRFDLAACGSRSPRAKSASCAPVSPRWRAHSPADVLRLLDPLVGLLHAPVAAGLLLFRALHVARGLVAHGLGPALDLHALLQPLAHAARGGLDDGLPGCRDRKS